jgi:hypothetical protein
MLELYDFYYEKLIAKQFNFFDKILVGFLKLGFIVLLEAYCPLYVCAKFTLVSVHKV